MTDTRTQPTAHEDTPHTEAVRHVRILGMHYPVAFVVFAAIWVVFFLSVDLAG